MKSALPKVLHPLLGRTLSATCWPPPRRWPRTARWSWSATAPTRSGRTWPRSRPDATPGAPGRAARHRARRPHRAGRGAATPTGTVVVLNGDVPLLRAETLAALVERARGGRRGGDRARRRGARPDRARPDRPGRRRRGWSGSSRSATPTADAAGDPGDQRRASTRSTRSRLRDALGKLSTDNDQGEEYLTDVFGAARRGRRAGGACTWPPTTTETLGCNDRVELAALRRAAARPGQRRRGCAPG